MLKEIRSAESLDAKRMHKGKRSPKQASNLFHRLNQEAAIRSAKKKKIYIMKRELENDELQSYFKPNTKKSNKSFLNLKS